MSIAIVFELFPYNFLFSSLFEIFIGPREWSRAKKSFVRREGAWMRRADNTVFFSIYERTF